MNPPNRVGSCGSCRNRVEAKEQMMIMVIIITVVPCWLLEHELAVQQGSMRT